jgi:hypothetical protein
MRCTCDHVPQALTLASSSARTVLPARGAVRAVRGGVHDALGGIVHSSLIVFEFEFRTVVNVLS